MSLSLANDLVDLVSNNLLRQVLLWNRELQTRATS